MIANAPDIAMAAQGVADYPATAEALKSVGQGALQFGKEALQAPRQALGRLGEVAKAIVGVGERKAKNIAGEMTTNAEQALRAAKVDASMAGRETPDVLALKDQQAAGRETFLNKQAALKAAKTQAGENIGKAEKEAGIGLDKVSLDAKLRKVIRNPERLDNAVDVLDRITSRGPEYLAEKDTETLQRARKFAEEAQRQIPKGTTQYARITKYKKVITEALGQRPDVPKSFAESVQQFRNVSKALENLPAENAREAAAIRTQIRKATSKLRTEKFTAQERVAVAQKALNEITPQAEALIRKGVSNDLTRKKALLAIGGTYGAFKGKDLLRGIMGVGR
jgi:hypothetical protein